MFVRFVILCALAATLQGADFPEPFNTETTPGAPMPAAEAASKFKLPPGFKATVFAAEPDVQNPIACAWDARGRLWVAENYTYAEPAKHVELGLRDRILIFEDTDGDGHFDKRTVFTDELQMLTSVELGFGGVYALCPPQLLFIPMQDDRPSGPAQVLLDGFTVPTDNMHNFANGLRWGPDGWLYGRCGTSAPGRVAAPGTADADRVPLNGGIWRYHPQRKVFEVVCHGTMNPWGLDWNEHGDGFFTNTVNGHLWQLIPGAHFARAHSVDPNPNVYELIDQCADHYHFDTGKGWTSSRDGGADQFGGGHAHCGAMVYLGDNWPDEYRGKLFTLNFLGRHMNVERLEREGSGYVGKHDGDICFSADPWFRGIDLTYGPDGGVFVLDWSDTGECHESTGVHRTSGRIFKITYGDPKRVEPFDLAKMSNEELVKLHEHKNEWWPRMARRVLAERAVANTPVADAVTGLQAIFAQSDDPVLRLRALHSLFVMGAADRKFLEDEFSDRDEYIRAWAIRYELDDWPFDFVDGKHPVARIPFDPQYFEELALRRVEEDHSALVRLACASSLFRLSPNSRAIVAAALGGHAEDASDHNLPLLEWYAIEPLAERITQHMERVFLQSKLPIERRFIARRLASDSARSPDGLNNLLVHQCSADLPVKSDIIAGLTEGFTGWRKAPKPEGWDAFVAAIATAKNHKLDRAAGELSALFGDGRALDDIKHAALDAKGDLEVRRKALETLIAEQPPDLRDICEKLLGVQSLGSVAARGLSQFDDPKIGELLAKKYRSFHPTERPALLGTLAARPAFVRALLAEMAAGKIPRGDLTAFHARQIRGFGDQALNRDLAAAWGELRDSAEDKRALMAKLKAQLTPEVLAQADAGAGRVVFNNTCAVCHTLYGHGGKIGPDLTGSNRNNLDYLLENIVDPSAVVSADFRMTVVTLKDGRVLNGIVAARTDRTLTLRTMTDTQTVERGDLQKEEQLPQSMMPEGLLLALSETQVRDLIAYLLSRAQVPLP